ncbi:MAG: glycerophosphodiester phosphodiesterase [Haloferacaceae archaeon]
MADRPILVAHRGFAGEHPENTVAAMRAAASAADSVELDVMPTADGDVVVFHDARLHAEGTSRGMTDATGVVWETPTEQVLAAGVRDSGETVPTLSAVVDAVPRSVTLDVELKNPGTFDVRPGESLPVDARAEARRRWQPFVDATRSALADAPHDVRFSSFCEGALAAVRHRDPDASLAVLCRDAATGLALAERYDADAVHPELSLLDGDLVQRAHDANRRVHVWTVRTADQAARARDAGVDGLIADSPFSSVDAKSG